MPDRRFAVFRHGYRGINPESRRDGVLMPCVEVREEVVGYDRSAAFRVAKRLAGWTREIPAEELRR